MSTLNRILICGSEGEFEVWPDGTPLSTPSGYNHILQMDLDEWEDHYQRPIQLGGIDILDIGYWYIDEKTGSREYEPPVRDWRARIAP